jgi:uncharacterized protein (TIGR02231 family)
MKKIFFSFLCIITAVANASTTETAQDVSTPVKSVVLYLNGAEITHTTQVNLSAGRNKVVFIGLTPNLLSKSIQVNVPADVTILSVSDRVNYLAKQEQNIRIKQLKDSSDMLNDNLKLVQNDRDAFTTEKQMLIANQSIGGSTTGVAVAALKPAVDFFRSRIQEINGELFKLDKKEKIFTESLSKVDRQLEELNAKFNAPTAEVTALVTVAAKTTANFELKYIVGSAGWAPLYDLRAEDIGKPIELKYRANVFNNTGIDWSEVKLKLSTADPLASASQPELSTWHLDYEDVYLNANGNMSWQWSYGDNLPMKDSLGVSPGTYDVVQNAVDQSKVNEEVSGKVKYEEIQVSELSVEFDIKTPYTVPSDAKPYLVDVTTYNLPATYQHYSAPKVDRDAFLLARITGWEDLNLVEGVANVYYAGAYVGRSYISTQSTDDTLNLSLGRDRKVVITRTKLKDLTSTKFIGSTRKEVYAFEIVAKNNTKAAINLELNDQIPVSKQGDITVESIETSKAELDPITGKLKWNFILQPDEVKKIQLEFSIKYPKNKSVTKQKFRTVACPSF